MAEAPALRRLVASILFIEQPITRAHALDADVSALSAIKPVIVDESDDGLDVFPRAKALGYRGVSSKCCKGLYKSILNAARCAQWNAAGGRYVMTGEDLTTQAGLAVQQDLALINLIGLTHVERNGHHYVNGMMGLPEAEQAAFLAAHPDLYENSHGAVRLKIRGGQLAIGSLAGVGFASGAMPDWDALTPMPAITLSCFVTARGLSPESSTLRSARRYGFRVRSLRSRPGMTANSAPHTDRGRAPARGSCRRRCRA